MAKILKKHDKVMKSHSLDVYSNVLREMAINYGEETMRDLMSDLERLAMPLAPGTV